jgi:hypothetical protein
MKNIEYLNWIAKRLEYKHKDTPDIVEKLKQITNESITMPKSINSEIVEACCKKHFFDFNMDKSEDFKAGYTENERNDIRKLVIDIYSTIKEYQCQN